MAKPSPIHTQPPRLLVVELWGLGDLALVVPFLQEATNHARVTLLAKPHAGPLLAHFAPAVEHLPCHAPWTAFSGKYRLFRWPWRELAHVVRELRRSQFDCGVSARPDPRDHLLLALAGARRRIGFSRFGSWLLLSDVLARPETPHRFDHWRALATRCGWSLAKYSPPGARVTSANRRIVIHAGAAQPARQWPHERFQQLASRLRGDGWQVVILDESSMTLTGLIQTLSRAERFIGNDSGPGHLAALLGVPTYTIFGPSMPALFSTLHPRAGWIEGAPCRYRPCWDACRFAEPHCIRAVTVEDVWGGLQSWLRSE